MGDGRAEGSSAIGDRGQDAISLMPDDDGTLHVHIFESSQLEGSYVGGLLYMPIKIIKKKQRKETARRPAWLKRSEQRRP